MLVPILIAGSLVLATSSNSESSTNWTYSRLPGHSVSGQAPNGGKPVYQDCAEPVWRIVLGFRTAEAPILNL
jgi:hypothetical protein